MKYIFIVMFVLISIPLFAQLPDNYQSMTAQEKQDYLWNNILETKWDDLPELSGGGWSGILKNLKAVLRLRESFDHVSDEMPLDENQELRPKIIHPWGTAVKIEFVPNKEALEYLTGIYQGAIGLARLSLAGDPSKIDYTPGMALKFFMDGQPSVNLHVMNSLDGQGDNQNFFEYEFSNILPKPKKWILKPLEFWFSRFVKNPRHLNIDHLALQKQSGEWEANPSGLSQIFFVPTEECQMDSDTSLDFREGLEGFPVDSRLYQVEGIYPSSPNERWIIGDIYTRSEFVASEYGDKRLYFQHHE